MIYKVCNITILCMQKRVILCSGAKIYFVKCNMQARKVKIVPYEEQSSYTRTHLITMHNCYHVSNSDSLSATYVNIK